MKQKPGERNVFGWAGRAVNTLRKSELRRRTQRLLTTRTGAVFTEKALAFKEQLWHAVDTFEFSGRLSGRAAEAGR
jgi:hypothetical protein